MVYACILSAVSLTSSAASHHAVSFPSLPYISLTVLLPPVGPFPITEFSHPTDLQAYILFAGTFLSQYEFSVDAG